MYGMEPANLPPKRNKTFIHFRVDKQVLFYFTRVFSLEARRRRRSWRS
jgi:hypothetical protein